MAAKASDNDYIPQDEEALGYAQQGQDLEPVATEPLKRVHDPKHLNSETQLDTSDSDDKDSFAKSTTNSPNGKKALARAASDTTDSTRDLEDPEKITPKSHRWYQYLLFKRKHLPPVPDERTVCPEYGASFISRYWTFQWMAPIMDVGYQRPLELNDLWLVNPDRKADVLAEKLMVNFKRRRDNGEDNPLLYALRDTLKFEFYLAGITQLISSLAQVLTPYVLRYLITFATEAYLAPRLGIPGPSIGHGVGLVIGITVMQMIQSGTTNQSLYRGMINGGQARAVLIAVVFDKAMKISGRARAGGKALEHEKPNLPANIQPGSKEEVAWMKRQAKKEKKKEKEDRKKSKKSGAGPAGKNVSGDGQGWGNGRIVNLMSVDTYRVDQASAMFHMVWTSPVAIVVCLVLLLINLTYSALAGFGLFIIMMPVLGRTVKSLITRRKSINKITDERVSLTQEILHAVRFVKYFGWETSFLERLEGVRYREIRAIQVLLAIRNAIMAVAMSMPIFASMLAFICFSLTHTGGAFTPAKIFSSLALFNSLRMPLNLLPMVIGQITDAVSSIQRIEEFLSAEEAEDDCIRDPENRNAIDVKSGCFTWERNTTKDAPEQKGKGAKSANIKNAANPTKEEKKAAKQAEKDEKKAVKEAAKEAKRHSKETGRSPGDIEHEAQEKVEEVTPFHMENLNLSIGRNELVAVIGGVGSGKSSLLAALAGDMRRTNGQVVMGANRAFCPQYAWIQNATVKENILFGKDHKEAWYEEVIDACALRADLDMLPNGDLTEIGERGITVSGGQKQRLNIARAIYFDADIVLMDDPLSAVDAHVGRHIMDNAICGLLANKCRVLATHQLWVLNRCDRIIWMKDGHISATGTFNELMASNNDFVELIANNAQEEKHDEEKKPVDEDEVAEEKKEIVKHEGGKKPPAALMQTEERAVAGVSWQVYKAYFQAAGSLWIIPVVLILLLCSQGANIVTSLWLSWWVQRKFEGVSEGAYIGIYALLGFLSAFFLFAFSVACTTAGTQASKVMLHGAITRVLRAPMSFFDTTPLGRITNRFSKDVDTMDNVLTDSIRFFAITVGMIVAVFILIIAYFYYFAVALGPLLVLFLFSASFYRSSAREVKRHEAVLRSVVFARFSEAVNGIATIRAYGLQDQFATSIRAAIDDMDSAYYLTFSNQRWLSVRLDIIGNLLVFVVGILVVTSRFSVSPATGGLVLAYILSIVQMIQFVVRQLAEVENNMNSTERLHHYGTQLEEEPPLHQAQVPDEWPQRGEIVFENVQMRYRDGLPLVLKGLDMHVGGGERIGVVGRTGAGKSSIMSTLFRLIEISAGRISIDGVDISTVGLADLRSRLSIIPQDPTLFRGTVRSNLDPFGRYTDHQLWSALQQADLVGADQAMEDRTAETRVTLDSAVEEEGLNFSLGQRQLMALARALVRGSQIIVCDEATSSVDMQTDEKIQRTIVNGFRGKTLLCIAHRLKTIINYDRICVMDQGRIAELDTPLKLYEQGGIFRSMCDRSSIRREDFA